MHGCWVEVDGGERFMSDYSFVRYLDSKFGRFLEYCAIFVGPALLFVQIALYVDQALAGRLTAVIPWLGVLTPVLVSIGVTAQFAFTATLVGHYWRLGQRRHAGYLLALALPAALFVLVGQIGGNLEASGMTASEAWTLMHFTHSMVEATVGLYGVYATFVGETLRREIKQIRSGSSSKE